ncbi:hypothetical protein [Lacunimicrobium album]|jgi:hypothetical protein
MTSESSPTPPQFVLSLEGELHGADSPENRELVRRIHACYHACEGISTDELESGIIADMSRIMAQVIPLLKERESLMQRTGLRHAS